MTFDEQYTTNTVYINESGIRTMVSKFDDEKPCTDCGTDTMWADVNLGKYFCSLECLLRVWQQMYETIG